MDHHAQAVTAVDIEAEKARAEARYQESAVAAPPAIEHAAERLAAELDRLLMQLDRLEHRLGPVLVGPGLAEAVGPRDTEGRSPIAVRFHAGADVVGRAADHLADLVGRVDLA